MAFALVSTVYQVTVSIDSKRVRNRHFQFIPDSIHLLLYTLKDESIAFRNYSSSSFERRRWVATGDIHICGVGVNHILINGGKVVTKTYPNVKPPLTENELCNLDERTLENFKLEASCPWPDRIDGNDLEASLAMLKRPFQVGIDNGDVSRSVEELFVDNKAMEVEVIRFHDHWHASLNTDGARLYVSGYHCKLETVELVGIDL